MLEAHRGEPCTGGLQMRESPLSVLGLRLIRGMPADAMEKRLGEALPTTVNRVHGFGEGWIVGTEPRTWRIFTPWEHHQALVRAFADLPPTVGLASDMSSRVCTLELSGPSAAQAISSACPIDTHPKAFEAGRAATSVLLGSSVLIVKTSETPSFLLSCERPYAPVVWDWLATRVASP